MKIEMSATLKESHDSKCFVRIDIEDQSFNLYMHNTEKDDCYSVELTPHRARVLAQQLEFMANFLDKMKLMSLDPSTHECSKET